MRIFGIGLLGVFAVMALLAGMTLLGTPHACVERASTTEDRPVAASWDVLVQQATVARSTSIVVSEVQATALAARAVEAQRLPVSAVRVTFCPDGLADLAGRVTLFGWSVDAMVRAGVDSAASPPRARITGLRVGALPALFTNWMTDLLVGATGRDLPVPPGASVRVEDGRAVVSGTVRP